VIFIYNSNFICRHVFTCNLQILLFVIEKDITCSKLNIFCANCTLPGVGIEYGVESDDVENGSSDDVTEEGEEGDNGDDGDDGEEDEKGDDDGDDNDVKDDDDDDDGNDDNGDDDDDDDDDDEDDDDDDDDDDDGDDDGEYEDVGEENEKSRSVSVELSFDSLVRSVVELGDAS